MMCHQVFLLLSHPPTALLLLKVLMQPRLQQMDFSDAIKQLSKWALAEINGTNAVISAGAREKH